MTKTAELPFGDAHTHIAHIREYPQPPVPPPLGVEEQHKEGVLSPPRTS